MCLYYLYVFVKQTYLFVLNMINFTDGFNMKIDFGIFHLIYLIERNKHTPYCLA